MLIPKTAKVVRECICGAVIKVGENYFLLRLYGWDICCKCEDKYKHYQCCEHNVHVDTFCRDCFYLYGDDSSWDSD